jgi:AraC-like DNA-binding protein
MFNNGSAAETLKMTELLYLILSNDECCLKNKILNNIDSVKESFEQIINDSIFEDISIEELASKCGKSLTSFKKDFKKQFYEPPHKWFIRQRLMHSRLLLISTDKSISEVGSDCGFPNTSHFIKLFKKEYSMTPANYRSYHCNSRDSSQSSNTQIRKNNIQSANNL